MMLQQNIPRIKKYSRIISLVPSQTELLFYLGLEDEVIGITKFCVHPKKWFRNKTRVGGTKNINFKTIDQLSPDLIIANKEENEKEQIEKLAEKYDVWVTEVATLSDAIKMINDIGKLTQKSKAATTLAIQINDKFKKTETTFSLNKKMKAAYFIWQNPYMVAGGDTFISNMMNYCGFENIFSNCYRYPEIQLIELEEKHCEIILLSSEPYPFSEKHKDEIKNLFPQKKIILVDGKMFSWYGSRLLKAADYFKNISLLE
ncbi:MAG: helical backbone metal receptor [Bacteroidota bacterium]|nr:helical backbone metal receptor [Bacteroidota bacterium]